MQSSWPSALLFLLTAAGAYLLGCVNGAILVSRAFYHDDVRDHGSGNAGLTNYYRSYGARFVAAVIAVDALKTVAAVLFARAILGALPFPRLSVSLVAGLFCVLGHIFPIFEDFRGGKAVLCCATLTLLLDWRVALVFWGLFWLVLALTHYVSLGSVTAAVGFAISCALVGRCAEVIVPAALIAGLIVWAHRTNIRRLLSGTESRFSFRRRPPEDKS